MLAHYVLDCAHTHSLQVTDDLIDDPSDIPGYCWCSTCCTWSIVIELADPLDSAGHDARDSTTSIPTQRPFAP